MQLTLIVSVLCLFLTIQAFFRDKRERSNEITKKIGYTINVDLLATVIELFSPLITIVSVDRFFEYTPHSQHSVS